MIIFLLILLFFLLLFNKPPSRNNIKISVISMNKNKKQPTIKNRLSISIEKRRISKKSPNYIHELQNNQQIKISLKNIYQLNDVELFQICQEKDMQGGMKIIHQIQTAISDCPYGNDKRLYYRHLSVFYSNKAYVLGQLQHNQESIKMLDRSIKNYQMIFNGLISKEEQIAYVTAYVKLNLKFCALLSHSSRHMEAVAVAQKCIAKIANCLNLLASLCMEYLETAKDTPATMITQSDSRVKNQKVDFKKIIIKQADKILSDLDDLPNISKLINQQRQHFIKKIKNMYLWKKNLDNNIKNIRKQLLQKFQSTQRNLLGLQKSSSFLQQFNLSELMSLQLSRIKTKTNLDTYYLLSAPKIIQLILISSVCYFTIATQTRFNNGNLDVNSLKINQKYKTLNKDQNITNCKIIHMKSIELAGKYLPQNNDYYSHLINSFNKNYKCVLDQIKEQSEISIKNKEINQTYYHKLDQNSHVQSTTFLRQNGGRKDKKKRSVSKDKEKAVVGLKRKIRSNSAFKKL